MPVFTLNSKVVLLPGRKLPPALQAMGLEVYPGTITEIHRDEDCLEVMWQNGHVTLQSFDEVMPAVTFVADPAADEGFECSRC